MKIQQKNKIEWKEVAFPELVWFQEGPGVRNYQFTNEGVKLLNVKNIISGSLVLDNSSNYISLEEANGRYNHFLVDEGDIIMASSGVTWGKTAVVKKENLPLCMNTSTIRFKVFDCGIVNKNYLWIFLKSKIFRRQIENLITGGCQPNFGPSHLKKIKISLPFKDGKPDLQTQKQIVSILEKAEALKQKQKRQLELYDEYLESLFYEMFGDKKLYLESGSKLFEFSYGKSLPKKDRSGKGYNVYGSNGIVGKHKEFLVEGPGIIIGRKGSIGEIVFSKDNFWPIDTTYFITQKKEFKWIFLYYLLKFSNLQRMNKSAAIPGLNRNDVYSEKFIYPPLPLQEKFSKIVEKVEKLKEKQKKSLEDSEELFNALMQKAFNGELV